MQMLCFKYTSGHDIRIEVSMNKKEILQKIKEAKNYIEKLNDLMASICIDVDYLENDNDINVVLNAHQYLKDFLVKFDAAQRGGIHDFMELTLFNMINHAINKIDYYLQTGHKSVSATEIMHITIDAYQFILDRMKGNLRAMKDAYFK